MQSPWLDIPLADYEGHMALPEVGQAQMLAGELESAVRRHAATSLAVIGCAGGNGFERLTGLALERVVGIDINPAYVEAVRARFDGKLSGLELLVADIQAAPSGIAPVDLVFAALIFEYVDVPATMCSLRSLCALGGNLIVVLQAPSSSMAAVSASPYTSLQQLAAVLHPRASEDVREAAIDAGFSLASRRTLELPSGKRFEVLSLGG
jgi:trans-aconitate methyltransferase